MTLSPGTWAGGIGWSGSWTVIQPATPGSTVQLNDAGSITRTLSLPIPNATLSFSWDMDRIGNNEYGYVDVFSGAWYTVWSQTEKGDDVGNTAQLLTAHVDLSAYGPISQIRFGLVGDALEDRFWIGFVTLNGTSASVPTRAPTTSTPSIPALPSSIPTTTEPTTSTPTSSPSSKPTSGVRHPSICCVVRLLSNMLLFL